MSVFKHHFLQHPGSAGHVWKWPGEITLDKEIKWTVMTDKVWKWDQNEVGRTIFKKIIWLCPFLSTIFYVIPKTVIATLRNGFQDIGNRYMYTHIFTSLAIREAAQRKRDHA